MEKRILVPPKLDDANLGRRLVCHRPCRREQPRMCVEHRTNAAGEQQIIGHNYGHAGSGWSLAPGVVAHVNGLLVEAMDRSGRGAPADVPVVVIGAGVIGLFTAYNLLERGFRRVTIMAEEFDGLPSHNAGGFISSTTYAVYEPESQILIKRCAVDAYLFYIAISRGQKPEFPPEAAKQMPVYFDLGVPTELEPYIGTVLRPPKEVLVQFGDLAHRSHRMLVFDDNIFLNVRLLMATLRQLLANKGVEFVQRKVNSFEELGEMIVVNCAGIGAKELCRDGDLFPVQGHLIMLKNQCPTTLNYLILVRHEFDHGTTESGHTVQRELYMFPKRSSYECEEGQEQTEDIGLIGGTFIQDCGPDTQNLAEHEQILKNAREWFGWEENEHLKTLISE